MRSGYVGNKNKFNYIKNWKWFFIGGFIFLIAAIAIISTWDIDTQLPKSEIIQTEVTVFGALKTYKKNKLVIEGCEYWHITDINSSAFSITHSGTCPNH